eukprot:CAMPEP_0204620396 /NCGR_PEP_ID=MMETSP0717-20131115/6447_1 /ASSEMBLY_ACC=CAM_ASM_000666 /TAXON_ID=230516 /ORGANISM="Chaetoceros curvisetus" /LENGTH=227 /DNA_ID=CAMNT_0051634591 /DNA_START=25 /DNA_END=708 /DNA_ORIENTATION=-
MSSIISNPSESARSRDELANAMESLLTIYNDDVDSDEEVIIHGIGLVTKTDSQNYEGGDEDESLPYITISNELRFEESEDDSSIDSEALDDISYYFSIYGHDDYSIIPNATTDSFSIISDDISTVTEEWDIASDAEDSDWDAICPDIQSVFSFDDFNFPFRRKMVKPLHPSSLMKENIVNHRTNLPQNDGTEEDELVYLVPDIDFGNGDEERYHTERPLSPLNINRI